MTSSLDIAVVAQNVVRHDGQGRAMLELTRELADRGHQVTVYAHRLDPDLATRVSFRRLPALPGPQLVDDMVMMLTGSALTRLTRHQLTCVLGPIALPPRPFVLAAHFSHRGWRRTWTPDHRPPLVHRLHAHCAAWVERWVASRADLVLANCPEVAKDLPSGRAPTIVAPPGVDLEENVAADSGSTASRRADLAIPAGVITVGFLGGYATGRKGLMPLIEAVAAGDEHLIVGGGGDPGEVALAVRRLGVQDRVHLLGFVPSEQVLAASDVVAVPSQYEPFSLVALEAAARGLPLVIARQAGVTSFLGDYPVPIEQPLDPRSIRAALDILQSAGERARRGALGPTVAAPLSWKLVTEAAADAIESVVQS